MGPGVNDYGRYVGYCHRCGKYMGTQYGNEHGDDFCSEKCKQLGFPKTLDELVKLHKLRSLKSKK